ncbi:MAG: OsmC family protein [Candidatus Nitrosocaldus sp.]|nr:OsmC family protein [Candidatus Nitrosocaldus sp.]MDW8000557.1 OsmC family protein [Candidatus Nitrosocaldus sp.]
MAEMVINNVDLSRVSAFVEQGKRDSSALRKVIKLEGEWILDSSKGFQFRSEMAYEKGKQVLEIDSPTWLGGQGNRLGPMAYCIAGLTSCFIATFASVAASKGIRLKRLRVSSNCTINFAKTLDVANEPITESINFDVDAEAENADRAVLEDVLRLARERCPAVYSMEHTIRVNTSLR